ncbi:hypothetical protein CEXT_78601 [Caerostris extrusa]|uniref:Uncharacterized protein n=1 Tax=Caerostris extrusa TaxID=172846 RepID=A0AAV4MEH1_CAEEX|nr:hypothetical protein CEXT_78601 [Caerostris extrusa]
MSKKKSLDLQIFDDQPSSTTLIFHLMPSYALPPRREVLYSEKSFPQPICNCSFSDDQHTNLSHNALLSTPTPKRSSEKSFPLANLQVFVSIIGFKSKNWSMELTFDTGSILKHFFYSLSRFLRLQRLRRVLFLSLEKRKKKKGRKFGIKTNVQGGELFTPTRMDPEFNFQQEGYYFSLRGVWKDYVFFSAGSQKEIYRQSTSLGEDLEKLNIFPGSLRWRNICYRPQTLFHHYNLSPNAHLSTPKPKKKPSILRVLPLATLQLFVSIIGFKCKELVDGATFDTGSILSLFFSFFSRSRFLRPRGCGAYYSRP